MSTEAVYMAPNAAPKCPFDQPLVNPYERPNSRESSESTVLDILGEDKVELLVERFYHYNLTDRKTRLFFQGVNIERLQRMQTTFLIHLLGGKQMNMTRMRAAHKRLLDLNDSHFDAMLKNLTKAGKDLGISSELRERILAAAETTRDDVLGRNSAHEVAQQRRR
ncbi:globin-like protein [Basidiobolus meristosporus CBS 931.73]|uniref:Globin-like protein n=1 Tax=Basidiobolus meristosporus CBS 931.73 TaxID=1314790 RepID=A0A1Y1YI31_9FUNG|nr:globin-like protein [Basidiobolus meristosporus CBS 931.73]|eukprot:ORX97366.1 globin-like protein [Basidiobolus meristosporus CBS 931.73]